MELHPHDLDQLATWAAAADAALRLLPSLAQLAARWSQPFLSWDLLCNMVVALANSLLLNVWMRHAAAAARCIEAFCLRQLEEASPPAVTGQLLPAPRQLWRLHSTSCRLNHWLVGQGAAALQLGSKDLAAILHTLHLQFYQAYPALNALPAETSSEGRALARYNLPCTCNGAGRC